MTTQTLTPSLIELGAAKLGSVMAARRRSRSGRPPRGVWSFVGRMLGTLLSMICLVAAAFSASLAAGLVAAGVAFLLLDYKASVIRKQRAEGRRT